MRRALVISLVLIAVAVPAEALEGRLVNPSGSVILWRSKDAMDEGNALMRANTDPRLIVRLAACAVKSGTRAVSAIKTEGSMFSGYALAVTVIDGQFSGCRGFVTLKEFDHAQNPATPSPADSQRKKDARGDIYPTPTKRLQPAQPAATPTKDPKEAAIAACRAALGSITIEATSGNVGGGELNVVARCSDGRRCLCWATRRGQTWTAEVLR